MPRAPQLHRARGRLLAPLALAEAVRKQKVPPPEQVIFDSRTLRQEQLGTLVGVDGTTIIFWQTDRTVPERGRASAVIKAIASKDLRSARKLAEVMPDFENVIAALDLELPAPPRLPGNIIGKHYRRPSGSFLPTDYRQTGNGPQSVGPD